MGWWKVRGRLVVVVVVVVVAWEDALVVCCCLQWEEEGRGLVERGEMLLLLYCNHE